MEMPPKSGVDLGDIAVEIVSSRLWNANIDRFS